VQGERLLARPGVDLALGELSHQPRQALHVLAMKGRKQQLALS
jgi:hypothetical protein